MPKMDKLTITLYMGKSTILAMFIMCVIRANDYIDTTVSTMANILLCSYNCRGAMSSSLYIDMLLNDVDILCIQEHHLTPVSVNFLRTLNNKFDVSVHVSDVYITNISANISDFTRRNGGLAIMWRKDISYSVSEVTLPICTDRIMAIRLDMPDKVPLVVINVYFPTTNMSVNDYQDVIDDLQVIYDTYINDSNVIVCGDFNGQLGSQAGPRGNNPPTIRGQHLLRFLDHNAACSLVVDGICDGQICTFWPGDDIRSPSQIDHFIISRDNFHIVQNCSVCDDHSLNTSDHVPIFLSVSISITRHLPYQRVTYN